HLLDADRLAIRKQMNDSAPPRTSSQRQRLRGDLRAAMRRHPAEPYFPLMGGALAWQEQDENPVPWLQRALERSRANGRAHLLLADVLHQHGARLQALMELRLALSADP